MADKDDTSKVRADRKSDPARVSAETSPAEGDRKFPTRSALTHLERAIEAQRAQLLHSEVLRLPAWSARERSRNSRIATLNVGTGCFSSMPTSPLAS